MKRERVEVWMREAARDESLEAFLLGQPAIGGDTDAPATRHPADLQVQLELRGYDPERRIAPYSNLIAVLTDRRVLIASVGGMWGARPKEVLHAAARGDFRCEWWINDASEAPANVYFNAVFHFPDGAWAAMAAATKLLRRTVAAAALTEELVSALGSDGVELDWRSASSSRE
ncbi:MAG: hypothetical protein R3C15_00940 [Thermoleophilia bacterium]